MGTITMAGLFEQTVDVDRLTEADRTPYERRLASSTNPSSDPLDATTWYGDADGFLRWDGVEKVILESFRPGAMVRFWTANPNGRLRVYLDGEVVPTIDADMAELFAGTVPPFTPPFVYVSARGANFVHPIAWAQSVRVTVTSGSLYYTLDYREYAPDAVVETYPGAPSITLDCARRRASETLRQGQDDPVPNAAFRLDSANPAAIAALTASGDGGVIASMRLRLSTSLRDALARTALRVEIDGQPTIDVPLTGALVPTDDAAPVESLPLSSAAGEWILRLPMPFARTAHIWLEARGGPRVTAALELVVGTMAVTDSTYRLHARHLGATPVDVSMWPGEPTLASVDGEGRFVGLVYEVASGDPSAQWWGEGDPIVTVDDRTLRGTGTEDHFLFGFCSTERFASPFSGQTRANAADNGGIVTLYRFHTMDDVPFRTHFGFAFELLSWGTHNGGTVPMSVSATTWFYGRPTVTSQPVATGPSPAVFTPLELPAGYVRPGSGFITCG